MKNLIQSVGSLMSIAAITSLSSAAIAAKPDKKSMATNVSMASVDQQYGSYVILGQSPAGENMAIARTVIETDRTCPTVSRPGQVKTTPMITRENPNHFSVLVCEALIGFDKNYQINFSDGSIALPVAKSNPVNIQVFGDSGCKAKDCAINTPAEPFKSLADAGAADKPDLVLHMGDFNYRGTSGKTYFSERQSNGKMKQVQQWPYDAGDGLDSKDHCGQTADTPFYSQSATNSNRPDIWRNWKDDLFTAGQKLLAAAPWITARGNHELCSRAGPGYFYFMDPNTNLTEGGQQWSCPTPHVDRGTFENTTQPPSYKVSFQNLDILMMDSANACDNFSNSDYTELFAAEFAEINGFANSEDKQTWLVTHRPIWGIEPYQAPKPPKAPESTPCDSNDQYACVGQMMQKAIEAQPTGALADNIDLVITGHMHKFQSVSFPGEGRPANLIVGSSGVALAGGAPYGDTELIIDGLNAEVLSTASQVEFAGENYAAFGFMRMQLTEDGGWEGLLVNPAKDLVLAQCSSEPVSAQGMCRLAPGISVPVQE